MYGLSVNYFQETKSIQTMRGEKREDNPSILRYLLRLKRDFLSCNELFLK